MKRRSRSIPRTEPYLKFLKPGALARLRDSRINNARSHRFFNSTLQISILRQRSSPSPPSSPSPNSELNTMDVSFLCFSASIYCGPRCLQRKKLIAAKTVLLSPSSPVLSDSPNPIVNNSLLNRDGILVAH